MRTFRNRLKHQCHPQFIHLLHLFRFLTMLSVKYKYKLLQYLTTNVFRWHCLCPDDIANYMQPYTNNGFLYISSIRGITESINIIRNTFIFNINSSSHGRCLKLFLLLLRVVIMMTELKKLNTVYKRCFKYIYIFIF